MGAMLKPEKCIVYRFRNGWTSKSTLAQLPSPTHSIPQLEGPLLPLHLTVPLPDGSLAPIPMLPFITVSLMLGIWFGPDSHGTKHITEMYRKEHEWADCLHSHPLPHSAAWTSFLLQIISRYVLGTINGCPFFQGIVSSNQTSIFLVSSTLRGSTPYRAPMAYPPKSVPRN